MKKYLLSAFLMLTVSAMFAQETSDFGKNRFGVALGYTSIGGSNGDSNTGFSSPVSYERIFGESGKLGLQVGMNMDFLSADENSATAIYAFDVALNWYITGQAKGFYVAPTLKIGSLGWAYDTGSETISGSESYTSIGVNAGYQFQISKLFGVRPSLGYDIVKIGDSDFGEYGALRLGVGFNFSF